MSIVTDDATRAPLHIDVRYFDEAEKQKLLQYPTAKKIERLVADGCKVSAAQFLTYYLFNKKRPGKPGYRSYAELGTKIARALNDLDEWVEFRDGSIVSASDAIPQDDKITECIGEAGALCVVGQLHGLHEADWEKIPEHPGPKGIQTFDYRHDAPLASDGIHIVQVEAKGTSAENTAELTHASRQQKYRIDHKKGKFAILRRHVSPLQPA